MIFLKKTDEARLQESVNIVQEIPSSNYIVSESILSSIRQKMKEKVKQSNEKRKKKAEQQRSKNFKKVLQSELVKERTDFAKAFYSTLSKYPKLKRNYDRQDELYQDEFEPEYDFNIVYGEIAIPDEDDEAYEQMLKAFGKELREHEDKLKYHDLNPEYQGEYIFYQLYNTESYGNAPKIVGVKTLD